MGVKVNKNKLTNYELFSGGAFGSDAYFGIIGQEYGIQQYHFRPPGNERLSKLLRDNNIQPVVLSKKEMDECYKEVAHIYGKDNLEHNIGNDLKARNYYQVKNADAVFAIAKITGKAVKGGTNVAVQLGILQSKPVYVYDYDDKKWYLWSVAENKFIVYNDVPILTKKFAGVGTRGCQKYQIQKNGEWIDTPDYLGISIETEVKSEIKKLFNKALKLA